MLRCSFLEIYNEVLTDLLNPEATHLQIREDVKHGIYVEHLSEHVVASRKHSPCLRTCLVNRLRWGRADIMVAAFCLQHPHPRIVAKPSFMPRHAYNKPDRPLRPCVQSTRWRSSWSAVS